MWVSATGEVSKYSSCRPTVCDLHSRTVTHFSMIRHHLIRQLWDRYKPVFAGKDIMKVSGTTCTSQAGATAIVNYWQHPGPPVCEPCCLPAVEKAAFTWSSALALIPEISAAHFRPGWSPGGQGLPTGWSEWDVLKWKGGLGERIHPNKQDIWRKKGFALWRGHICCSTGYAPDNVAVNLTPESTTSSHQLLFPAINIPPAPQRCVLLEHGARWLLSCCCWRKGLLHATALTSKRK